VRGDITVGRIAGIRVGVHWSWAVVAALIVWTLAEGVFPDTNPDLSGRTHLVMAAAAAALFFASILLHELGHAVQARRDGMEIDGITLWLFGGVAAFRGRFPSAMAELRIALAGPLVSLVLGAVFVGVAATDAAGEPVDAVAAWLGYINLSLLVFNLLPALPLDGGRVLRSLLWRGTGDLGRATGIAGNVARGIAVALIALGLGTLILVGSFAGAWLAFLGWFLLGAAESELRAVGTERALAGLRVRDLMTADPVAVPPDMTVGRLMDEVVGPHRYTTYPVVDGGRALGLMPFRRVAGVPRRRWDETLVADLVVPLGEALVVDGEAAAVDVVGPLTGSPLGRALVLAPDGRLIGVVSVSDLARALELPPRRGAAPPRTDPAVR
jgi:Zn-dependent protease